MIEHTDGKFYVAYVSHTEQAIIVKSSTDGIVWSANSQLPTATWAHMGLNLFQDGDALRMFFARSDNLYSSYLGMNNQFVSPTIHSENRPFGADAVSLTAGGVGIVYSLDLNEQRDIFFENIEAIAD